MHFATINTSSTTSRSQAAASAAQSSVAFLRRCLRFAGLALGLMALAFASLTEAGGNKGNKGGNMEDIIMYNGNIVLRGDKSGGSIVMANQHPHNEEVEFSPNFFTGDLGGFGRRRR